MEKGAKTMIRQAYPLALLVMLFAPPSAAQQEQCREFTRQIMIDGQMQDAYGTVCLQPDGTWAIRSAPPQEEQPSSTGYTQMTPAQPGTVATPRPTRSYGAQSYQYGYGIGSGGTSIYIGQEYPYYYGYGYPHHHHRYRWGRDRHRDNFYQHHHGPHWNKHWQHHQRTLGR